MVIDISEDNYEECKMPLQNILLRLPIINKPGT